MTLKAKFEIATSVIGLASNLGLPVDIFGGLIGGPSATDQKLAEIQAAIIELQKTVEEGFFDTNQNNFFRQNQQALEKSQSAFLVLNNPAASDSAKADARDDARDGISNVVGAVNSLVNSQVGTFTPQIVQDMYTALAFSLSVQINASAALSWGEKVGGSYEHGGFLAAETQIQAGVDALNSLAPAIRAAYFTGISFAPEITGRQTVTTGSFPFFEEVDIVNTVITIGHDIADLDVARAFYQQLATEILRPEDQDFGPGFFAVLENEVRIIIARPFDVNTGGTAEVQKVRQYTDQMELVVGDFAFSSLTGLKTDIRPGQFTNPFFSWNEPGAVGFGELIAAAEATIDGKFVTVGGIADSVLEGTSGGDFIKGSVGNDRLFGFDDDDYLLGGAGNDLMFGGEGNDRYFNESGTVGNSLGQDGFIDEGAETDIDVVVFEGNFNEYTFFDDTGTTGPRIKVSRSTDPDADTLRGIEILKFDDVEVAVRDLPLSFRDITAPDAPFILGLSDDLGVSAADRLTSDGTLVITGTSEANSFVTVSMDGPSVGRAQTDESGNWSFDFGATTDLDDGSYTFTAFSSDAANNSSSRSTDFIVTIDKTAPSLETASMTSSSGTSVSRVGDTVTLLFTPSEFLSALPQVTLAGITAVVTDLGISENSTARNFSATVTLDESAVAGDASILVTMTDPAGNEGTGIAVTKGSPITIDVPVVIDPETAINGDATDNSLIGTADADLIRGFDGNDEIRGLAANDVLLGGNGNDRIFGDGLASAYVQQNISGTVFRLYQATLDRAPDVGGYAVWADRLSTNERPLLAVADAFVASPEFAKTYDDLDNTAFVELLYSNVLDRAADTAGLTEWLGRLANGTTRAEVVLGFSDSAEFVNATRAGANVFAEQRIASGWSDEVYGLYQATLAREPDVEGLTGWTSLLAGGERSLLEVANGFVASPEFANTFNDLGNSAFVDLLYQNVLDRPADTAGLAEWVGRLASGTSRAEVVLGFSTSPEFVAKTAAPLKAWMRDQGEHDRIDAGRGDNEVAGDLFADTFVFSALEGGTTSVLDLEPWDMIELNDFGYTTTAEALAGFSVSEGGPVVFADQFVEIVFRDIALADITGDMIQI